MKIFNCIVFLFIASTVNGQKVQVHAELTAIGIFSSEDEVPFWFSSNTNAAIGTETKFSGIGDVKARYDFSKSFVEIGTAWFYRN